jgi:hypothetical protein
LETNKSLLLPESSILCLRTCLNKNFCLLTRMVILEIRCSPNKLILRFTVVAQLDSLNSTGTQSRHMHFLFTTRRVRKPSGTTVANHIRFRLKSKICLIILGNHHTKSLEIISHQRSSVQRSLLKFIIQ